jgi:hypothetical protein
MNSPQNVYVRDIDASAGLSQSIRLNLDLIAILLREEMLRNADTMINEGH